MKMTSSNTRMCVVTRKRKNKDEMLKISNKNYKWIITDEVYVGRSIYITKDKEIINKFLKKTSKKLKNFNLEQTLREELIDYAKNL